MDFKNNTSVIYKSYIRNKLYIAIFLVLALIVAVVYSIKVGAADLSVYDVVNALFNRQAEGALIVWNIRIPRILAAIIAGCCMGIEGCIMQNVLIKIVIVNIKRADF